MMGRRRSRNGMLWLGLSALALTSALAGALPASATAPPDRFQITTNGTPDDLTDDTVLDVQTQLRWERSFSTLVGWDASGAPGSAQAYCAALSVGAYTSGWRLPGVKELLTIVDVRTRPAFDAKIFPGIVLGYPGGAKRFWTATPDASSAVDGGAGDGGAPTYTSAWLVGVGSGHSQQWRFTNGAGSLNVARCVHAP